MPTELDDPGIISLKNGGSILTAHFSDDLFADVTLDIAEGDVTLSQGFAASFADYIQTDLAFISYDNGSELRIVDTPVNVLALARALGRIKSVNPELEVTDIISGGSLAIDLVFEDTGDADQLKAELDALDLIANGNWLELFDYIETLSAPAGTTLEVTFEDFDSGDFELSDLTGVSKIVVSGTIQEYLNSSEDFLSFDDTLYDFAVLDTAANFESVDLTLFDPEEPLEFIELFRLVDAVDELDSVDLGSPPYSTLGVEIFRVEDSAENIGSALDDGTIDGFGLGDAPSRVINLDGDLLIGDASGSATDDDLVGDSYAPRLADVIFGIDGNDEIYAGEGDDVIYVEDGDDWVYGGAGDDFIKAKWGFNVLIGDDGKDTIFGGGEGDWLDGKFDDDVIYGGDGDDDIFGDEGADELYGEDDDDWIYGGPGEDTIAGGTGDDTLSGDGDDDTIDGEDGVDVIYGGLGNDTVTGGKGNDDISGEDGNDSLDGGEDTDWIYGGPGSDTINGGNGVDYIHGGEGQDTLSGGDGNDVFTYELSSHFGDIITDFNPLSGSTVADQVALHDSALPTAATYNFSTLTGPLTITPLNTSGYTVTSTTTVSILNNFNGYRVLSNSQPATYLTLYTKSGAFQSSYASIDYFSSDAGIGTLVPWASNTIPLFTTISAFSPAVDYKSVFANRLTELYAPANLPNQVPNGAVFTFVPGIGSVLTNTTGTTFTTSPTSARYLAFGLVKSVNEGATSTALVMAYIVNGSNGLNTGTGDYALNQITSKEITFLSTIAVFTNASGVPTDAGNIILI